MLDDRDAIEDRRRIERPEPQGLRFDPSGRHGYFGPETARFIMAFILILAVILCAVIAMIARIQPDQYAQYVAPLTGLAGVAVGYWFGRTKD